MARVKGALVLVVVIVCIAALAGCAPKFPICKTDDHCKNAENNQGKIVCINGQCQECGKDEDCGAGKVCKANRCEIKPECLADVDCKGGLVCRNQKCVPECTQNTDCGANMKCDNSRCIPAFECMTDTDCKEGNACSANKCVAKADLAPKVKECQVVSINFEFNKYEITTESKTILEKNADCMKQKGVKNLVIEGNCDERGTTEYNLNLGHNRAEAAKRFMQKIGVKDIKTISYGKEKPVCRESTEDCWLKNRRDDFVAK